MPPARDTSQPMHLHANPCLLALLGWLVPGSGFFLLDRKYRFRGILFLVVIHATFVAGVALRGGAVWPSWSFADPSFIVNDLTFLMQMLGGWPALFSLGAHFAGWSIAADQAHTLYELGSFYCLVAGALNYFVVCQSLSRNRRAAVERLANNA